MKAAIIFLLLAGLFALTSATVPWHFPVSDTGITCGDVPCETINPENDPDKGGWYPTDEWQSDAGLNDGLRSMRIALCLLAFFCGFLGLGALIVWHFTRGLARDLERAREDNDSPSSGMRC